jgi:hypothetical protein
MIRQGVTIAAVSQKLGCDLADLSNYIRGAKKMPEYLKDKLSAFLGIPVNILFSDEKTYFRFILEKLEVDSGCRKKENPHRS